jgi:hypothetical protein
MKSTPIVTAITRKGQPYVDEPVVIHPRRPSELTWAVWGALGTREEYLAFADDGQYRSVKSRRVPDPIQVGWQRVYLNWIKPEHRAQE